MSLAYDKNKNGARNGGIYMNYSGGPKNNKEFDYMSVQDRTENPNKLFGKIILKSNIKNKNLTKKYFNKLNKK